MFFFKSDPDKSKFISAFFLYVTQLYICEWVPDLLIQEVIITFSFFCQYTLNSDLPLRNQKCIDTNIFHKIQSEAVSTAAYFASLSKRSNLRTRKLLSIVIRRAQRPVTLTAAGFIKLSIETFGSMITNAVSFFTVLRSFTVKDLEN